MGSVFVVLSIFVIRPLRIIHLSRYFFAVASASAFHSAARSSALKVVGPLPLTSVITQLPRARLCEVGLRRMFTVWHGRAFFQGSMSFMAQLPPLPSRRPSRNKMSESRSIDDDQATSLMVPVNCMSLSGVYFLAYASRSLAN